MPRTCTVCRLPSSERKPIEAELIAGTALRNISQSLSHRISVASLWRHKGHLPKALVKAKEAREVATADGLLSEIQDLQSKTLAILAASERSGDHRTALSAIREARQNLELLSKLLGLLRSDKVETTPASDNWPRIRLTVLEALSPYPEARSVLAQKLLTLEPKNESGS